MAGQGVKAWFRLWRPLNVVMAGVVQLLFVHCFSRLSVGEVWPVIAGLLLLGAGGNALNDYYDRTADRYNRPGKNAFNQGLPTWMGPATFGVFSIGAIMLGMRVAPLMGALFAAIAGLLWWYSAWAQRRPLVGNVLVALFLTLPLVVWCYWPAQVDCSAALHYAAVVFCINLLRELIKDQEDMAGDGAAGYRTWPVVASARAVRVTGHVLFGLLYVSLLGLLQWIFGVRADFLWFMVVVLGVLFPAIYLHFIWHHSRRRRQWRAVQRGLKVLMAVGLATLGFGCGGMQA